MFIAYNIYSAIIQEKIKPWRKIYPLEISVHFEYTLSDTPQHNGVVERKYQTLLARMREIMNGEGIKGYLRKKLWE